MLSPYKTHPLTRQKVLLNIIQTVTVETVDHNKEPAELLCLNPLLVSQDKFLLKNKGFFKTNQLH